MYLGQMATIYRASSVWEAIQMAKSFKKDGRYDWFRGQIKAWPPTSTLHRIESAGEQRRIMFAHSRIQRFENWCNATSGLENIASEPDAPFAIAQHYGIATHLIDFTTDPGIAGFFACDSKQPPESGSESCIYCLDSSEEIVGGLRFRQLAK
jgi:hypothetical protein